MSVNTYLNKHEEKLGGHLQCGDKYTRVETMWGQVQNLNKTAFKKKIKKNLIENLSYFFLLNPRQFL